MDALAPFASPLYLMAKPVGSRCNLRCDYCYYLEKEKLYSASGHGGMMMDDRVLEAFIRQYIESQTTPAVLFTWHGGEPLLRDRSYYEKIIALERRYARGIRVDNAIQTNGTLLDDDWCRFFRDNGWLVGLSVDGPEDLHDRYRRTAGGGPSFAAVMRAIETLDRNAVDWNALAVVNVYNARHPDRFYDFFRSVDCHYLQFTPVVERLVRHADGRHLASAADTSASLADFSVTPGLWGDFLCRVFDRWVRADVGTYFVQLFDATLANWVGVPPGVCSLGSYCGHAGVVEHNGDIYSCDHFVFPEYRLGNILDRPLLDMMYSGRQRDFGAAKRGALPRQCRECRYTDICNGECPRNRFVLSADGQPGLNYLCEGYYRFFSHSEPYMRFMRDELLAGRPASNVMALAAK